MEILTKWEVVHTLHDYFDGPISGVADYNDTPHIYYRISEDDEWTNDYWLSPISVEQFGLVMADWERWQRWEAAFYANALGPWDKHPVLEVDRLEAERARPLVEETLKVRIGKADRRTAEFAGSIAPLPMALKVRWSSPF